MHDELIDRDARAAKVLSAPPPASGDIHVQIKPLLLLARPALVSRGPLLIRKFVGTGRSRTFSSPVAIEDSLRGSSVSIVW